MMLCTDAFTCHWPLTTGRSLAAGFITPGFAIAGLLLAGIPILIHILNRRRYKTVQWAAMEFLLRAMRKNRRRLKFEQWILLATRCLVLLLAGIALARPLGCRDSAIASMAGTRSGLHVIVIDNSYSTAYEGDRTNARTHLDRGKQLAKELIDTFQAGGEAVAIITASRPAASVLSPATYDLQAARGGVDRVQQAYGSTDLLGALRAAQAIANAEKTLGQRRLYLITDGTRSAWETPDAAAIKQLGPELARQYRVAHFHLGKAGQWNQVALDVKPAGNLVSTRLNNDLTARLHSFGQGPDALLQWKLDDSVLPGGGQVRFGAEPVTLAQPGASFRAGGAHVVSAGLVTQDRLKIDDTRHRVLDVASEMKVLIVEGERGMSKLGGSGAFLELALAPPREATAEGGAKTDSYVAPEVVSDLELGNKVLTDYRAVILAGVAQLTAAQADQLALFVKQGGGLITFMGEPVVGDSYNQVLLPRGLVPGPLTKRVSAAADQNGFLFDFKPHGSLHPLLGLFSAQEKTGLDTAQIFTYWQIDLKPDAKVERVLDYLPTGATATGGAGAAGAGGGSGNANASAPRDPAIVLHTLGQGHVITFTTTANAEWTSFPAKPSYVALMHELLAGSIGAGDRWMNLTAGEPLMVPRNLKLTGSPTLFDPQQKEIVLEPLPAGGPGAYRSGPLVRPGVYRLSTGASSSLPIAVNVPPEEADVRTLDNNAVKRALGDVDVEFHADTLPPAAAEVNRAGTDFGWPFMLAVLLFVAGESFMAMRFGHYRRTSG
ncbi:MAG TPA: BatA domain-containing protein [Tepidisphaeraceae bacterium]|nr:BatA domain-containing protein [Tepidisphaeraceae bacterium]